MVSDPSPLKAVYLLTGGDRPKIQRALERLRARFGEGATEVLSAHGATGADAVSACNAIGLFGDGGRLVVVEDVERWKAADVAAVVEYLGDPAPGTVLAVLGDVRKDSPLAKAAGKQGEVLAYDITRRDLPRWVGEQFTRVGARADAAACRALVNLTGDDLIALAVEVEKLAPWAGGDEIDERAVELLASPQADTPLFAVTDAWGARDRSALIAATELALERSPEATSSTIPRIVGTLGSHVGRVRKAQALAEQGIRPADATKELGDGRRPVHRFVAEKAFAHSRNYSREELDLVIVRLAELDVALKGGSRLPARFELERALSDLTG